MISQSSCEQKDVLYVFLFLRVTAMIRFVFGLLKSTSGSGVVSGHNFPFSSSCIHCSLVDAMSFAETISTPSGWPVIAFTVVKWSL